MRPNLMKILLKKVLVGLVNSAQDPLSWTQMQLKPSFSSIQTHAKSITPMPFDSRMVILKPHFKF